MCSASTNSPTLRSTANSFYLFRNRYFDMVGYGNHTPVIKRNMETEFTEKLHSIAYRATKAECLDLPEFTDIVQHVDLEPAAQRVYRQLVKDSYAELSEGSVTVTNVLTRLLRLSQLTGGFVGNDDDTVTEQVSSAKLDALSDLLDSAENDGYKLVIIARFIPEIHAIERLLQKKDLRYAMIYGGVTDRPAQIKVFQNDPDVRVFIGQIATAGPRDHADGSFHDGFLLAGLLHEQLRADPCPHPSRGPEASLHLYPPHRSRHRG